MVRWHLYMESGSKILLLFPDILQKADGCHGANFAVAGGIGNCHYDKERYSQWRQSWHYNDSRFDFTVNQKLSWYQICRHWWHRLLSFWQPTVAPLTAKLTSSRRLPVSPCVHDDVIKMEYFPRYRPFVRGIHRSRVNSPTQRPVTRSFDVSCDLRLNKRLRKQL